MFNPNARWDRPLPCDIEVPGDPVDVVVSCKRSGLFPIWFFLHGAKRVIKNILLVWKENKGRDVLHLFSVCDEQNNRYTLCCNRRTMHWNVICRD